MSNPVKQVKTQEFLEIIASKKVKFLDNDVKLRSLYRAVCDVKKQDLFNGTLVEGIYLDYINQRQKAIDLTETLLTPNVSDHHKVIIYNNLTNYFIHLGLPDKALEFLWNSYQVAKLESVLDLYIDTCRIFLKYDSAKAELLSEDKKAKLYSIQEEIEMMESKNLNRELYEEILSKAYNLYSNYCVGDLYKYVTYNDSCANIILFHDDLDIPTVGMLNDKLEDILVDLSFTYSYEELLKYPIYFTSEKIAQD